MNMKPTLFLAIAVALSAACTLKAQTVILKDDFESYEAGPLPASTAWPSAIPDTTPPHSWTTNAVGGPQAIEATTVGGRNGQFYHYIENATGQTRTYSLTELSTAPNPTDRWVLTIDFYIDQYNLSIADGGFFGIVSLANGSPETAGSLLTSVSVGRNSVSGAPQIAYSKLGDSSLLHGIELNQWYTITIAGDNSTKTFDLTITGTDFETGATGVAYANNSASFTHVSIGDHVANAFITGRHNSAYLDNLNIQTIPEPHHLALLGFGAIALIIFRKRK